MAIHNPKLGKLYKVSNSVNAYYNLSLKKMERGWTIKNKIALCIRERNIHEFPLYFIENNKISIDWFFIDEL